MALPIIGTIASGVAGVITLFRGWFGAGGVFAGLTAWFTVKFTTKALAVSSQILTMTALFLSRVAFVTAIYLLYTNISDILNDFKTQLPQLMTQNELMSLAYNFMRSVGLIDAFIDAFSLFNVLLFSLVSVFIARIAFESLKMTSDEFFKLKVLIQQ